MSNLLDNILAGILLLGIGFVTYEYVQCAREVGSFAPLSVLACGAEKIGKDIENAVDNAYNKTGNQVVSEGCEVLKLKDKTCKDIKDTLGIKTPPDPPDCFKTDDQGCSICKFKPAKTSNPHNDALANEQSLVNNLGTQFRNEKGLSSFRSNCGCVDGIQKLVSQSRIACSVGDGKREAICRLNGNGTIQCWKPAWEKEPFG